MHGVFLEFAIALSLVSVLGFWVHRLKLPLVIAYLLSGVVLSLAASFNPEGLGIFGFLPDLGIAFVLFLIGMELDLRELRKLGAPVILASLGQVVISALAGYAIASLLGFNQTESVLLGLGLSFSSTVVIIKMLLEKRDLASLYGKLSVGILLIEDLVAVAVLMVVSMQSPILSFDLQQSLPLLILAVKAAALFGLTFVLSKSVLVKLFDNVAGSTELLFLTAITWCFLFITIAQVSGFPVTIGAFLAGVALASSPYHFQIQGKIKPLRDFFLTLFFVYLGTQVNLVDLVSNWPLVLSYTAYSLVVKPFIFLLFLGAFGFRKHTIYQTALNLSQISEFSLVIMLLAVKSGLVPSVLLSAMSAVAVLSMMFSSALITYSKYFYKYVSPFLGFFERSGDIHRIEKKLESELIDHVIIVGAHRVGGPIVEYLKRSGIPFVVMDFNPHVVDELAKQGVNVIYGDIGNPDILDSLQLERAKLIVSTATELSDNELLIAECNRRKIRAKLIVRALDEEHARQLKALGAEYVILPEKVSGDYLVNQLKVTWPQVHFSGLS